MMNKPTDFTKTTPVACEQCNNELFLEVNIVRKLSKVLSASKSDTITIIPVLQCLNCGTVLSESLPEALRQPKELKEVAPGLKMKL